jgi:hypothetical protein
VGESKAVGLLNALVDARDRPDLACQAYFTECDEPDGQGLAGLG